ncbi:hypothetical protein PGN_0908 [Porphyromonas gingivalis ATCC 33277]|uniref:Uncharacterized protein n=1 Tax=Porphyromonas gingivalis (strain ATCC 33277 / DSM 20709 / CIP 103683 / JCM 12257 / NCTC 11834 / 2561) TaxID=431947 RepID=B2RJ82_PORG3|nr:hypothetical protein PGN_0908 [Porphyromonas gingivalis ATCC 33277]
MWVPLFYSPVKRPFSAFDLYRNDFRSIYKLKTIYIFIVNGLYIDRYLISQKSCFNLKKSIL